MAGLGPAFALARLAGPVLIKNVSVVDGRNEKRSQGMLVVSVFFHNK